MLRKNPDADLPRCADDNQGENDRGLITPDTKTRPLNQTRCQIEFQLIQLILGVGGCLPCRTIEPSSLGLTATLSTATI